VRFNALDNFAARTYAELAGAAQLLNGNESPETAAESLARRLESMLGSAGLSEGLEQYGVTREDLPRLANEAAGQWTAQFNPRTVTSGDFENIYAEALAAPVRADE
jgi:alcohol dehydrogenase